MSTLFLLIRHASHGDVGAVLTGRLGGRDLTEAGRAQARDLAGRLEGRPIERVLASPRARAQQTAAAIADAHGMAVETEGALDEIDFGRWAGSGFAELESDPAWRAWNTQRGLAQTPAGDTMLAVQHRTRTLIRDLARVHEGGCVALVSHADVIRASVCDHLGLSIDHWARIEISPASVTTLAVGCAHATLLGLNEGASPAWS